MRTRAELLELLKAGEVPDVLIIGGGINGVGTYRDLAAQGIPALLVEAGDFASGTTSAPSRLIHGGLRYLETGEADLVRESLIERNLLLKNACHIVHPLPVWVPLRSWLGGTFGAIGRFLRLTRKPGRKGAIPVKIGLMIYDVFGRKEQTMPDHRVLSAAKARKEISVLAPDVKAVAEYYDARITHPERLVTELISDAEEDCAKSLAINYLAAGSQTAGSITLHDRQTDETFEVRPKLVINASGAWVDEVQQGLGFSGKLMGGTRGSHLVVRNPELAKSLKETMLYFETDDFRACLIFPMDDELLFMGTTDIRSDDPDDKFCTEEEIDYMFDFLRPILPDVKMGRGDIVFAVAGVRPLPKMETEATGSISRDHRMDRFEASEERPFETFTLVGGKWTTYRAFAEQVTDAVLEKFQKTRSRSTAHVAIGGAKDWPLDTSQKENRIDVIAQETGLDRDRVRVLSCRYGSDARAFSQAEAADGSKFDALQSYTPPEIARFCEVERVIRLDDVILRRSLIGFEGRATKAVLREVAGVMAEKLGWDSSRLKNELSATEELLRVRHRVPL